MRPSRRTLVAGLLVLLLVIGIAVIRWNDNRRREVTIVKIGVLLPLNADLMAVAAKMKSGMELAKEDLLAKHQGRLSVELDYQNGCFERETAAAIKKFMAASRSPGTEAFAS